MKKASQHRTCGQKAGEHSRTGMQNLWGKILQNEQHTRRGRKEEKGPEQRSTGRAAYRTDRQTGQGLHNEQCPGGLPGLIKSRLQKKRTERRSRGTVTPRQSMKKGS